MIGSLPTSCCESSYDPPINPSKAQPTRAAARCGDQPLAADDRARVDRRHLGRWVPWGPRRFVADVAGKTVNIKKGQFMGPESMQFAVNKVIESGNNNVGLIERGTTFGYQDMVVDFRGIPLMQETGVPVIMDCTHSLQQPNQSTGITGGKPALIETIAKAAVAVGVDGLFLESHPDPSIAKSDGANMLPLDQLQGLLEKLVRVRAAVM